jgi:LmbE family N-acetylglucosaminyl deacetylase
MKQTRTSGHASILERLAARMGDDAGPPRILAVFAHPDDEVLALGGRLGRFSESRFLCVTNGAPENGMDARAHGFPTLAAYRESRRMELDRAFKLAGLPSGCTRPLLLQEADGSKTIAADQAAAFHLVQIAREIAREISEFRPEAVLTHPYEGGHPDHDSCAFGVQAAVRLVGESYAIPILEAPFYYAGANGMVAGCFLPETAGTNSSGILCTLSPKEQKRKRELLDCFVSQRETLAQFGTERERFRIAPEYDFTRAPHTGRLFYENYDWGLTGARFRELVTVGARELNLQTRGAHA